MTANNLSLSGRRRRSKTKVKFCFSYIPRLSFFMCSLQRTINSFKRSWPSQRLIGEEGGNLGACQANSQEGCYLVVSRFVIELENREEEFVHSLAIKLKKAAFKIQLI